MTITAPRRLTDSDENRIGTVYGLFQVQREGETTSLDILVHQDVQAWLIDLNLTRFEYLDLARILVDANHFMPKIRETYTGHQSDVARADHRNLHDMPFGRNFMIYDWSCPILRAKTQPGTASFSRARTLPDATFR